MGKKIRKRLFRILFIFVILGLVPVEFNGTSKSYGQAAIEISSALTMLQTVCGDETQDNKINLTVNSLTAYSTNENTEVTVNYSDATTFTNTSNPIQIYPEVDNISVNAVAKGVTANVDYTGAQLTSTGPTIFNNYYQKISAMCITVCSNDGSGSTQGLIQYRLLESNQSCDIDSVTVPWQIYDNNNLPSITDNFKGYIQVKVTSSNGLSTMICSPGITVDTQSPTITGVQPGEDDFFTYNIQWSDVGSGIDLSKSSLTGVDCSGNVITTPAITTTGVTVTNPGQYTITIYDNAGNASTVAFTVIEPDQSFYSVHRSTDTNSWMTISNIKANSYYCMVKIDTSIPDANDPGWNTNEHHIITQGQYIFYLFYKDMAGNVSRKYIPININGTNLFVTNINISPTVNGSKNITGSQNVFDKMNDMFVNKVFCNQAATITINISNIVSSIRQIEYLLVPLDNNGKAQNSWIIGEPKSNTIEFNVYPNFMGGVEVLVTDNLGNVVDNMSNLFAVDDGTLLNIDIPNTGTCYVQDVNISDNISGLQQYIVYKDNDNNVPWKQNTYSSMTFNDSIVIDQPGNYSIQVTSNAGEQQKTTFTVTQPDTNYYSISATSSNGWYTTKSIIITPRGYNGFNKISNDGVNWLDSLLFDSSSSYMGVKLYFKDSVTGQQTVGTLPMDIKFDTIPPVVSNISINGNTLYASNNVGYEGVQLTTTSPTTFNNYYYTISAIRITTDDGNRSGINQKGIQYRFLTSNQSADIDSIAAPWQIYDANNLPSMMNNIEGYIQFQVTSNAGLVTTVCSPGFTVDRQAPTITGVQQGEADCFGYKIQWSDSGSGINTFILLKHDFNGALQPVNPDAYTLNGNSLIVETDSGNYVIRVWDAVGNMKEVDFTILKPNESYYNIGSQPSIYGWYKTNVTISSTKTYKILGENINLPSPNNNDSRWANTCTVSMKGQNHINLYFEDANGYVSEPVKVEINIDETFPIITDQTYENMVASNTTCLGHNLSWSDGGADESGVAAVSLDNKQISLIDLNGNIVTGMYVNDVGIHTLTVTDKADNVSNYTFKITAPDTSFFITNPSPTRGWYNSPITIIPDVQNNGGFNQISTDGFTWHDIISITPLNSSGNMEVVLYFRKYDASTPGISPMTSCEVVTLQFDCTKPVVDYVELIPSNCKIYQQVSNFTTFDLFFNKEVIMQIVSNDDASGVYEIQYRFVGSDGVPVNDWSIYYDNDKPRQSPNFKGVVEIRVIDNAGNISQIFISNGFIIDDVSPVISGVHNGANNHVGYTSSWTDNLSGIKSAILDNDFIDGNSVYCGTIGTHTLSVTDNSGNSTTVTFTILPMPTVASLTLADQSKIEALRAEFIAQNSEIPVGKASNLDNQIVALENRIHELLVAQNIMNLINNLPVVVTMDEIDNIVQVYKIFINHGFADISQQCINRIAQERELTAEVLHEDGNVTVIGLPWSVEFDAIPQQSGYNELWNTVSTQIGKNSLISLYDIVAIDHYNGNIPYILPAGSQIQITFPWPDITGFSNMQVVYWNSDGKIEYLTPTITGDGMITIKLDAISPIGVVGINNTATPSLTKLDQSASNSIYLWILSGLTVVIGVFVTVFADKKRKQEDEEE